MLDRYRRWSYLTALLTRHMCSHSHTFLWGFCVDNSAQPSRYVEMLREHFFKIKSRSLFHSIFPMEKGKLIILQWLELDKKTVVVFSSPKNTLKYV